MSRGDAYLSGRRISDWLLPYGPRRDSGATGHETQWPQDPNRFDRYNFVSMETCGRPRIDFGHAGEHTSSFSAVSGNGNPQILRKSTHGEVAERLKAAVC
jgi:hypothetical protein